MSDEPKLREDLQVKEVFAGPCHSRADAEVQLRCKLTTGGTLVTFNLSYDQTLELVRELEESLAELRRRRRAAKPQTGNLL